MKKLNLLIFLFVIVIQATFPSRLIAQINCPEPTGLTVTVNSQNSVTLTWLASNFSTIFNVQYQSSITTVNPITLNNVTSPLTITFGIGLTT